MSDSKVDVLLQRIGELEQTIKNHGGDDATLDKEALAVEVERILKEQKDAEPQRKGEPIGETKEGGDVPELTVRGLKQREIVGGRYDGIRTVDLWFAQHLCRSTALKAIPGEDKRTLLQIADNISGEMAQDRELSRAIKAMSSTGSGVGDELIGEAFASVVWDDMFLSTLIAGLFGAAYPMQAEKDTFPLNPGDATFRLGTQNQATTASDLTTRKVQLDASKELVAEVDFSYHLEEDAIIALVPEIRRLLARNAAEALDNVLLNGDDTDAATGNINLDDANPPNDSKYLIFDGIRHAWLVDASGQGVNQNGAPTADMFADTMKKLGKYAAKPDRLAFIMDIQTYLTCLKIDEVLTMDKLGKQATLLSGQLGSIYGIPIIISGEAGLTEADGKMSTTSTNNTKGQISLVHREMWKVGTRRQLLIEADRDIQKRQHIVVVSFRPAFNCYYGAAADRSSLTHAAGAYNITV